MDLIKELAERGIIKTAEETITILKEEQEKRKLGEFFFVLSAMIMICFAAKILSLMSDKTSTKGKEFFNPMIYWLIILLFIIWLLFIVALLPTVGGV